MTHMPKYENPLRGGKACQQRTPWYAVIINYDTVVSPINGHSNQRTPPISGQFSLHRQNLGQTLIENFLKSGQGISGHSNQRTLFSARKCIFYFFSPPFSGHPKNFSDQSRDNNKKNRLSYVYIYFKHLEILH